MKVWVANLKDACKDNFAAINRQSVTGKTLVDYNTVITSAYRALRVGQGLFQKPDLLFSTSNRSQGRKTDSYVIISPTSSERSLLRYSFSLENLVLARTNRAAKLQFLF